MAYNGMSRLFGSWRAHISALTFDHQQQQNKVRFSQGLNVGVQNRLLKNGANRKLLLGKCYEPKFVKPRGSAWRRVAMLSGL